MSTNQPNSLGERILEKIKARIILALIMTGIFGYVVYQVVTDPAIKDNPILLLILGGLINTITLIYVFYFRKAQAKEST